MIIQPTNDGIDHINIYSKGLTTLGRFLTNFSYSPFLLPEYGRFNSVEALWYFLLTDHPDKELLRDLHGFNAKKFGMKVSVITSELHESHPKFRFLIKTAIYLKLQINSEFSSQLIESPLPLLHYYVYNDKIVDVTDKYRWWTNIFYEYKNHYKGLTYEH